jgi:hypothetical protein
MEIITILDNSNKSAIFYYGNSNSSTAEYSFYGTRAFANLEPKDANIGTKTDGATITGSPAIAGSFSVQGDFIFYNKKDNKNNLKAYMYDTTCNREFLIADNSNTRLLRME